MYFVEEDDPHIIPLARKASGEIGIVGVAAAITTIPISRGWKTDSRSAYHNE